MLECLSVGVLECLSVGVLECLSVGGFEYSSFIIYNSSLLHPVQHIYMTRVLLLATLLLSLPACDTLQQIAKDAMAEPTLEEIGSGLKQALRNGVSKGVETLSQKDGYFKSAYKILLPDEARKVTDRLKNIPGFNNLENELLEKINRGAEEAAKEAGPIFVNAITAMTFQDARNILMGENNAATQNPKTPKPQNPNSFYNYYGIKRRKST